jgi:CubicO group peptidase (beta-lactamase class C family)
VRGIPCYQGEATHIQHRGYRLGPNAEFTTPPTSHEYVIREITLIQGMKPSLTALSFAALLVLLQLFSVGIPPAHGAQAIPNSSLMPAQIGAINRYVSAEMVRQRIPGAEVAVYRNGEVAFQSGYGLANVELNAPVQPYTLMQSGSVGKQFTATAVMMLVEEHKIALDDPITKYFPDAPASWTWIKVENLLSHTSGLAEYENDERTQAGGTFDLRLDFTEDELLKKIEGLPIEFAAGDKWDYRNTNYVLLGILIHCVTGRFYGDFLQERIFVPLKMSATRIISDRDIIPNRASGYEIDAGVLKNQAFVSPTFNSTADGALYFNVVDLERWDRALMDASVISPESLRRMWTPFVLSDGKPNASSYGFGWSIREVNGHRVVEHSGAWQGFTTQISRYLDDKLTVVVLTNLDEGHSQPKNLARVIAGLVNPQLMPPLSTPIADARPEIAAAVRSLFKQLKAGTDLATKVAPDAKFHLTPGFAAEILNSLPPEWAPAPIVLITRTEAGDGVDSMFRVGPPGNWRRVHFVTNAAARITNFTVEPDPDNR